MRPLRIATWNVNSVRLRFDQIARFVEEARPDVLCLQEIKCRDGEFPGKPFSSLGLRHQLVVGQKGWHGVAILARVPLEPAPIPGLCPYGEARVACARVAGFELHNLYVPAGGDEPDAEANPKFAHKLAFLDRMRRHYAEATGRPMCLVGDLNIAPGEHDVWAHRQLLDVVSHTPVETDALNAAQAAGGFIDVIRAQRPEPEKLFTWWSYRNRDWRASNRGRRLDHIWATPGLAAAASAVRVFDHTRDWERPSDHAPVMATFEGLSPT